MNAVGDQTAKGDGPIGPPAAMTPGAGTRPGEIRAVRTVENYYIGSEYGSDEGNERNWVMAVRARGQIGMIGQVGKASKEIALKDDEFLVLWDSGSDEHLTQSNIAKETGRPTCGYGPPIEDVQGNAIEDFGSSKLSFSLEDGKGQGHETVLEARISDLSDKVCSAGKVLLRETFRAIMDTERSKLPVAGYLQRKDDRRVTIPL